MPKNNPIMKTPKLSRLKPGTVVRVYGPPLEGNLIYDGEWAEVTGPAGFVGPVAKKLFKVNFLNSLDHGKIFHYCQFRIQV